VVTSKLTPAHVCTTKPVDLPESTRLDAQTQVLPQASRQGWAPQPLPPPRPRRRHAPAAATPPPPPRARRRHAAAAATPLPPPPRRCPSPLLSPAAATPPPSTPSIPTCCCVALPSWPPPLRRRRRQLLRLGSAAASGRPAFRQFTRLTCTLDDVGGAVLLSPTSPVGKSYDLLAVTPTSEKLFQYACEKLDIDIIALDLSHRLPFYIKAPQVGMALARGIAFEIAYSGALADQTARRYFFSNALALIRVTRGKNIVLTSGARDAFELRGPYDVMNLSSLFGLTLEQARSALSRRPDALLLHARTRSSTMKGVFCSAPVRALGEREQWSRPRSARGGLGAAAAAAATAPPDAAMVPPLAAGGGAAAAGAASELEVDMEEAQAEEGGAGEGSDEDDDGGGGGEDFIRF
jgi:hypothetical protein